jgi:hypothetical protein
MQNAPFRGVVVLALLVGSLLVVYAPRWLDLVGQQASPAEADFTYVTDVDYWQRTGREQLVETSIPFDLAHDLNQVPLQIGDWRGEDVPETNLEVFILLEPEQFVQRLYQDSAGHSLWLTLIGSRKSRSFHPPDLCYEADGWRTSLSSQAVPLDGGGDLYGLWLEAQKQTTEEGPATEHLVFYFYLFPDSERDQAGGIVLFKLISPRYSTVEETVALQGDFLRQLFSRATPIKRRL